MLEIQAQQDKVVIETPDEQTAYALRMRSGCNGGGKGALIQTEKSGTLATGNDQTIFQPVLALASKQQSMNLSENTANPLLANDYKEPQAVCMATQQGGAEIRTDDKTPTLTAAAGMSGNNQPVYANAEYTVRRLTPLECERLQGFPDGWTDIGDYIDTKGKKRKTSDSARYKALGNSIALPSWVWLLERLNRYCTDHTMASLFDGIGGFPLIWEAINGAGTCLWASEIDEFPMAVTRYHFNYD